MKVISPNQTRSTPERLPNVHIFCWMPFLLYISGPLKLWKCLLGVTVHSSKLKPNGGYKMCFVTFYSPNWFIANGALGSAIRKWTEVKSELGYDLTRIHGLSTKMLRQKSRTYLKGAICNSQSRKVASAVHIQSHLEIVKPGV